MQTRLDATMAPLKNNYFEIALFSFRTLKAALRNQRSWKISSFEQLIYIVRPHLANLGRLTLMNMATRVME